MIELGFDEVWIDPYGSVIGKVIGTGEGQSVLFDGHIDTVDVNSPEKWQYDPFGAEIANGKIYGRGSSDMKGAVCAAVIAVGEIIRETKNTGIRAKGDIYVSGTVFEEVFEGIALGKVIEQIHPDNVVIMEPSELNISNGQLGRAEVNVTAYGKSAHSSNPHAAINAIYELNPVITALINAVPPENQWLGKGISVVTDILSSPYPGASVIPDTCKITIDRRLLVNELEESVISQYEQLLPSFGQFDIRIAEAELTCYTGKKLLGKRFFPGWLMNEENPLVKASLSSLQFIGQKPKIVTYRFCTNGSYSAGIAKIPTIGYGPSSASLVHIVDEYIELEQLYQAAEGNYALAKHITNVLHK